MSPVQSRYIDSRTTVLGNLFLLRGAEVFIDPFAHIPNHTRLVVAYASEQHVVRTQSDLVHLILVTCEAVSDIRTISAVY